MTKYERVGIVRLLRRKGRTPCGDQPSYSHDRDRAKDGGGKIAEGITLTDNDPKKQMLSDHGASDPIDRVENMSFSYDFYATLYFNRFSRQPTGKPSDHNPNCDIYETILGGAPRP